MARLPGHEQCLWQGPLGGRAFLGVPPAVPHPPGVGAWGSRRVLPEPEDAPPTLHHTSEPREPGRRLGERRRRPSWQGTGQLRKQRTAQRTPWQRSPLLRRTPAPATCSLWPGWPVRLCGTAGRGQGRPGENLLVLGDRLAWDHPVSVWPGLDLPPWLRAPHPLCGLTLRGPVSTHHRLPGV